MDHGLFSKKLIGIILTFEVTHAVIDVSLSSLKIILPPVAVSATGVHMRRCDDTNNVSCYARLTNNIFLWVRFSCKFPCVSRLCGSNNKLRKTLE